MRVSEKSLELNVGAELLAFMRNSWNMPKAYLRGLTQREESREGVDFFVQMPTNYRIFAFQFKRPGGFREPRSPIVNPRYKFTLNCKQHANLHDLAQVQPNAVFYVFPFYYGVQELEDGIPRLSQDTWLLPVNNLDVCTVFSGQKSKTVHCERGVAHINPAFDMMRLDRLGLSWDDGIQPEEFAVWHKKLHLSDLQPNTLARPRNPHIVRGLRLTIVRRQDDQHL